MYWKRLIIHIGRHKSGTSSLQHWLGDHREILRQNGILFPLSGSSNRIAHHDLANRLNPNISNGTGVFEIVKGMRLESEGEESLLISSEAFQNINNTRRIDEFIALNEFECVHVVCYVREYLDYAISAFRQMVQAQSRFVTFSDFCKNFVSIGPFIQRWKNIGMLDLNWFDKELLYKGDIIADFCNRIGVKVDDYKTKDKNPSIGGNLLAFKLAANSMQLGYIDYKGLQALALDKSTFREPFFVGIDAALKCRSKTRYNEILFSELGEIKLKNWDNCKILPFEDTLSTDIGLIERKLDFKVSSELYSQIRCSRPWFDLK